MGCDPIVQRIHDLVRDDDRSMRAIVAHAGIDKTTLYRWRVHDPGLGSVRAILNALGYDLEIVRKK